MGTLIRAANLTGFEELAAQLGKDPSLLLALHHIDPALIRNPDAYIPFKNLTALLERAAVQYECPDFGLRLMKWQGLNMLGPVAVIARNAGTVLEAFGSLARYLHVHGPALKFSLMGRNAEGDYCFDYRIEEPGRLQLAQAYELSLANGVNILKLLAGATARPARVYFMHTPLSSRAVYSQAFGCPVDFECTHSGLDFREADMNRSLQSADTYTRHIAERYLDSFLPQGTQVEERVVELIHGLLATGHCSITAVADQLAMHPRTLQRALHERNVSYEDLVDQIRQNKLSHYLAQTGMRDSQVAGLLGYADQSTLIRACRRWHGCTPRQLRQNLKAAPLS